MQTLPMSQVTLHDHDGPWTEDEYLALGETNTRIELIDGSLWVSPAPNRPHQHISSRLWSALHSARAVGLRAFQATNLRLSTDRILIPDLVVDAGSPVGAVGEAADTVLVCDITSPSNAATDRVQKRSFYAEARIPWYLLVEPDFAGYESVTLRLFRLRGDAYAEHSAAKQGETLTSELPFPFSIGTEELVDY
ncbi:Uma2 family endonuclease [Actinoplanes regularis]|uniref:Uma2 family endonuclease n=1 Tax=Actinoplanes regularis TaxID=52697 RepID=UPI0025563C80|nr:Uma2 family endonuclease [Actinoplanes regularis]